MRYIKWTILTVIFLCVAAVLHYALPQRDIVRLVNTEVRRVDFGMNSIFWANSGAGDAVDAVNRDVLFIETIRPNGNEVVYRNEDTGFGWPPYFKFDTADLQAQARDLVSTSDDPQWVAVRHYGWRSRVFSIFPNAVSMKPVESADVRLIPWFNIIFLTILAMFVFAIWRRWVKFRRRRIDPVLEDAGQAWDRVDAAGDAASEKVSGWFGRLFGRPKK